MSLSSLTYTPAITGQAIHSTITGTLGSLDPNTSSLGEMYWTMILTLLYGDFDATLSSNVLTYLQQTEVMYVPGLTASVIFTGPPSFTMFMSKIVSSASAIDSNIKARCSGQKAATTLGQWHWEEAFKQIFTDIKEVVSQGVHGAYTTSTNIAPSGALAAPTLGLTAPIPATIQTPFDLDSLKGQLELQFNDGNALSLAQLLHSQILSMFSSYNSNDMWKTIGPSYWQLFMDRLKEKVETYIQDGVRNWILASNQHFAIPSGSPGTNPAGIPPTIASVGPMFGFMM